MASLTETSVRPRMSLVLVVVEEDREEDVIFLTLLLLAAMLLQRIFLRMYFMLAPSGDVAVSADDRGRKQVDVQ
jgi:hypothetical protein